MKKIILLIVTAIFLTGCTSVKVSIKPDINITRIRRVAVLPFGPNGIVSDMFITELIGIGKFDVIERGQLDKVLGEYKLSLSGILDEKTRKELGRLLGVDAIFLGSAVVRKTPVFLAMQYSAVATTVYETAISVRLVDIETGSILISCSTSGEDQQKSIEKIVKKIKKAFQ
ncbi:CsgG/HfaB family protein [bacterium]|nr:CsgG/HfaB family protein [bacterium]